MSTARELPCPFCKAKKGQECVHPLTGKKVLTHAARKPRKAEAWRASETPWKAVTIMQSSGEKVRIIDAKGNVIATLHGPSAKANARMIEKD